MGVRQILKRNLSMTDDLVCTTPDCGKLLCIHFTQICPLCSLPSPELDFESDYELSICNNQCFYCLVSGIHDLIDDHGVTFDEIIDHGRSAYKIGYRDGYSSSQLPEIKVIHGLQYSYIDGYNAGKKLRDIEQELEECKTSFCTLLPNFLAQT